MRTNKGHCNCRNKEEDPIKGKCNSKNMVHLANIFPIENNLDEKVYIRISARNWKQ